MSKNTRFEDFILRLEAFGMFILEKFFLLIGMQASSFIAGLLLTLFGPFTPPSFLAMRNIKLAMPELSFLQRFKIVLGMWNNLGRSLGEFVHVNTKTFEELNKRNIVSIESSSMKIFNKMRNNPQGEIVFTAHFGNWELLSSIFEYYNVKGCVVFRPMNNKYADKIVEKYRNKKSIILVEKGARGGVTMMKNLKNGAKGVMLVDQRLSNGIDIPFFNQQSKTTDSVAVFSLKYGYKVYAAVVFRKSFSCSFNVKLEEFDIVNTGNLEEDVKTNTENVNKKIEEWIRIKPEQWFWVHNRWKK